VPLPRPSSLAQVAEAHGGRRPRPATVSQVCRKLWREPGPNPTPPSPSRKSRLSCRPPLRPKPPPVGRPSVATPWQSSPSSRRSRAAGKVRRRSPASTCAGSLRRIPPEGAGRCGAYLATGCLPRLSQIPSFATALGGASRGQFGGRSSGQPGEGFSTRYSTAGRRLTALGVDL
jgi:hypothetical protein